MSHIVRWRRLSGAVGPVDRKLAAILSGDVVGFSRLTALDEEGTLLTLATYLEAIDGFVREHAGRIFGNAGDGFVAEFASAVQATRCAVAIQRSLLRRNADLSPDRRLQLRIGINLGDVVVSEDNLLGDGVNVAARLQEIASPSGICLSGSIFEHVSGRVSFRLTSLGERRLKNIPRPVTVFKVDWQAEDRAAAIVKALSDATDEAMGLGIFGSPTFVVAGEVFWGDDRLEDAIRWVNIQRGAT